MMYIAAFLRTWKGRIQGDILEAGLMIMTDERLRRAFMANRPLTGRKPGRRRPSLLDWLPVALGQLAQTGGIEQEFHEGMNFVKEGPRPPDLTDFPSYLVKAAEAAGVITRLGEQQAYRKGKPANPDRPSDRDGTVWLNWVGCAAFPGDSDR